MIDHTDVSDVDVRSLLHQKKIRFAGNKKLKIYGTLQCTSGKRMKKENRVFFSSEKEALKHAFRPCGNCMRVAYRRWSNLS